MTKPTDDELGVLLRETFADKENLLESAAADQAEERLVGSRVRRRAATAQGAGSRLLGASVRAGSATTRRRVSVVLAAASVLAVLGGVLYVAERGGPKEVAGPDRSGAPRLGITQNPPTNGSSETPGSTTSSGATASQQAPRVPAGAAGAWAAVILEIAEWERPAAGWPALRVLDAPADGAGSPTANPSTGPPFTPEQQHEIERLVGVPIEWVKSRPTGPKACDGPPAARPYVTVSSIIEVGAQLEIGANVWRGCLDARWLTYRLDQRDGKWTVTGTTGPQAVS